jgi:hypothetical protein
VAGFELLHCSEALSDRARIEFMDGVVSDCNSRLQIENVPLVGIEPFAQAL